MDINQFVAAVDYNGEGFSPIWNYQGWRIAISCDTPAAHLENIELISKHMETDETFTLINGSAELYIGDGADNPGNVHRIVMEQGKTLVVKAGTWHFTVTHPGTKIIITENADTGDTNTVKKPFCPDMLV